MSATCAPDELSVLLERSSRGELEAFLTFYDATSSLVWRLELGRWRSPSAALVATHQRFLAAWDRAVEHSSSGLSPQAWLLSLPTGAHAVSA
jgi:hypothetical protein